jgi:hypothetical protein
MGTSAHVARLLPLSRANLFQVRVKCGDTVPGLPVERNGCSRFAALSCCQGAVRTMRKFLRVSSSPRMGVSPW